MSYTVENIYRYPVKGLSAESLGSVALSPGQALPHDRRFALALGSTKAEAAATEWLPKTSFLMLMRNEKLATLETSFNDEDEVLSVLRNGKQVARGKLTDRLGRGMIEDFFAAYMGDEARGRPKLVEGADGRVLSDHRAPVVSLINIASVKDLERVTGQPVNPLRFRANIYFRTERPWSEFEWIDKEITIGGAKLRVSQRINRCAATNVDPETAERDMNIPKDLQRGFRHVDCGIYAEVIGAGNVATGDEIKIPD